MKSISELTDLLFDLCVCSGVSGSEGDASSTALHYLSEYMSCQTDNLGNVIGNLEGNGPKILLDAHLDQIGLVVTSVDKDGFLRVAKCGGADARVMSASVVTILSKENVIGIVSSIPPHLSDKSEENKAASFDNIYIDIGMSHDNTEKIIKPGDRIIFNGSQAKLLGTKVVSPNIDNRAGIAVILRCLEILKENNVSPNIKVLFSVQEETGGSGAITGSFSCGADEAIVTDVSFARAPGVKEEESGKSGEGVMIGFAPSLDSDISEKMISLAEKNNIKWQYDVMGGRTGTNCDEISTSSGGIKTGLLSVPIKNMHTPVEIADVNDIDSAAHLMAAYITERSACNA